MFEPMLASLADAPLADPHLVYEPKYDGIRAIAEIEARGVRLWSRLGNEKTNQFPEVAQALRKWRDQQPADVVLDGEIVALTPTGEPTGFQRLQGRIHVADPSSLVRPGPASTPQVAYIVFDLLKEGRTDWRDRPLLERRARLEQLLARGRSPILRISDQVRGDGRALYRDALARGWEGLIAKHAASLYKSGKRTPDWRKLKILREQEFVVGGWTDPRQTRSYFGALLLGVYEKRSLVYVGHTGTGFNEKELARLMKLLKPLETKTCPFVPPPKTNERPHWIRPELVAQIKFTEWTDDGKLRHPVYLGLRDDKKPEEVVKEEQGSRRSPGPRASRGRKDSSAPEMPDNLANLLEQLADLEKTRKNGTVTLPDGDTLAVTNLHKVFWPKLKLTKGDLFRYYVRVAPFILPVLDSRPLVMKRFPNGVSAKPFYQHRAPEVPAGVRVEGVPSSDPRDQDDGGKRPHIIGGSLKTLLYTTQLASISQDPWFSRVPHPEFADHAALDLDPAEGVPFERVLDVARWIRDELAALGASGWAKTSGAEGLHVYIPLPSNTPYDVGVLFCQIVGTVVTQKHPKVATLERSVAARGKRVYVDCLQNILGKTLASAYSVRATEGAGVSTPVSWQEVDEGFDRGDFTMQTVPARLEQVGDLWKGLLTSKGIDLARATRYAGKADKTGKAAKKR